MQSSTFVGDTGVQQGSSHGPLIYHQYADDIQLFIAVDHETVGSASANLAACTTAAYEWLFHNCLALNPDRSKSALFDTVARTKSLRNVVSVNVAGTPMSHCVKSLGEIFDKNLKCVSAVCKGCFFHIRALRYIRPSMSIETAKMVACAIVSCRFDYCN